MPSSTASSGGGFNTTTGSHVLDTFTIDDHISKDLTSPNEKEEAEAPGKRAPSSDGMDRRQRPQELEWNNKVDMVQQLINQTLMLSGGGGCPPLLLLPVGAGGTLSPLKSNMWPNMLPQFSSPVATVTSVSSYSPDSRGSTSPGDWTVVEVETQH
uniref:BTB/POZ domain-containing protein n=1 Tax=Cynoglossus semilaevis TaxID=244447 RepID=A0A3P8WJM2_CYNSE